MVYVGEPAVIATGSVDGTIRLWDAEKGAQPEDAGRTQVVGQRAGRQSRPEDAGFGQLRRHRQAVGDPSGDWSGPCRPPRPRSAPWPGRRMAGRLAAGMRYGAIKVW